MLAQVTVRFASTAVAMRTLSAGDRFWVGSAPNVDACVAGIGAFPIVTGDARGFIVRAPVGVPLIIDGRTLAGELRLVTGMTAQIAFGLVAIAIEIIAAPRAAPMPRPALDLRLVAYLAAALAAHLLVWSIANELGGGPRGKQPRPHLVAVHVVHDPAAIVPSPVPASPAEAAVARAVAPPRARATDDSPFNATYHLTHTRPAAPSPDEALAAVARGIDDIHVQYQMNQVGDAYQPWAGHGFGQQLAFHPDLGGTIASGRFQTISRGHAAGDDYDANPAPAPAPTIACDAASRATRHILHPDQPDPCDAQQP